MFEALNAKLCVMQIRPVFRVRCRNLIRFRECACVCSTRHADAVVHMRVHYLWKWDLPPAVAQWHVKSGLIQHSANARHTLFINSIQFPRTLISLLPPNYLTHTLARSLARSLGSTGWRRFAADAAKLACSLPAHMQTLRSTGGGGCGCGVAQSCRRCCWSWARI